MLVLVALHHIILNYFAPSWVFEYGRNDLAIIAHAVPVIITVIFTTILSNTHRSTTMQIQELRNDLQAINEDIKSEQENKL